MLISSVLSMVAELRNAGQSRVRIEGRKIGKAFSWADGIGADYVVIIGPKDLESGQASVKRLSDGEQFSVSLDLGNTGDSLNHSSSSNLVSLLSALQPLLQMFQR